MRKVVSFIVALCLVCLSNVTPVQANTGNNDRDDQAFIELARAHVTIDSEGMFVIGGDLSRDQRIALRATFAPLNANLASVEKHLRPTLKHEKSSKGPGLAAPLASFCGYVPKWALQAFAWYLILTGAVVAFVGLVADTTIVGIPAGIVLGGLGIAAGTSGSFLLWWVDNNVPPWGVWVCV
jgi:hypothetical protein